MSAVTCYRLAADLVSSKILLGGSLSSVVALIGNYMPEIKTEFLITIDLDFEISVLGETPYGIRCIAHTHARL